MLYETIKDEIKNAMKNKDTIKRDCLKNVLGKARGIQKDQSPAMSSDEISDAIMLDAIQKEVKQLNQTITALEGREDTDLYMVSTHEIEILKGYLPKQMSRKEIEEAVSWILGDKEYKNFGEKIKYVMKELKGKADNKIVREVVENYK